jgi:carboxyl-terminal processing protease
MRSLLLATLVLSAAPTGGIDELRALETFDAVWSIIDRQHFDPTFNGVDWKAVRDELRPRAEAAEDREALRAVVREMLGRLGQSHFGLVPAEDMGTGAAGSQVSPAGTAGLDLRWIDECPVIVSIAPSEPAALAGVQPGWVLTRVGGEDIATVLSHGSAKPGLRPETDCRRRVLLAVDGPIGSSVALEFVDRAEHPVSVDLERVERDAEPFDMRGLPTFFLQQRWTIEEHDDLSIGVLWFSNWFRPLLGELDAALVEMRGCDGIVIDLRGNTGGDGSVTTEIAGHFFDEESTLGTMRMRRARQEFTIRPRRRFGTRTAEPFLGPLAILVDETTGSSSEVFTGGMQSIGRAHVVGQRTAGAALPATLSPLPNGDSLIHAIADFATADGTVLEGTGVLPDELVVPTRADWSADRDRALAAALTWIATQVDR